jgi:hypothetical protein
MFETTSISTLNRQRFQFGQILGMNLNHFQIGFHFWFGAKCKSLLPLKLLIKVSLITLEEKKKLDFIHYFFSKFPIHYPPLPNFLLFELNTTPMQTCNTMCQFGTLSLGMKWNVISDQNNI